MTVLRLTPGLVCSLLAVIALIPLACPVGAADPGSRLAFAAYRNGQWDLYSVEDDGTDLRQLTDTDYEDRDPAYSPDGTRLAFASRRDRNWDVYVLDLGSGQETRLTEDPAYDGAPTWSPDSRRIAFESARAGGLDVWELDLETDRLRNLTADSEAGDYAPAWSPIGNYIAFTSWRAGDKDLFLLDVDSGSVTQVTAEATSEEWPAWRPDGRQVAFVRNWLGDREILVADVVPGAAGAGGGAGDVTATPLTWFGRDDSPAWAPGGDRVAFVNHRFDGEQIMVRATGGAMDLPVPLTGVASLGGRLAWSSQALKHGSPVATLADTEPASLYEEDVTPSTSGDGEPWDLVEMMDTRLPTPDLTPYLSDCVDDSFIALRRRLTDEVGYDFLGNLSEAYRPYQYHGDASEYASWHKSGRAVDTLFDFDGTDGQMLEIVRDDIGGETYWRVYLRCSDQSGRCGQPLTANAWNYSRQARTQTAPDQGGTEQPTSGEYYVDLTTLMREYGWLRIASWNTEEFSWTWHFKGFEYWHFQKTQGLSWYAAMREVIAPAKIEAAFTYDNMLAVGDHPFAIALKGVSLPAPVRLWWSQVQM